MAAITFIETRQGVQEQAFQHIKDHLDQYQVESKGVYIQDVVLPAELVSVLTQREIANQEVQTYQKQTLSQAERIKMEQSKGTAEMQAELARSEVGIRIKSNIAEARIAEAKGEATYIRETGTARGAEVEAVGLARARGYEAQVEALGQAPTALVNMVSALSDGKAKFMPEVLVTGGCGSGVMDALAATFLRSLSGKKGPEAPEVGLFTGKGK